MKTFNEKLTAMFEEIEPEFLAKQKERFKNMATSQFEGWMSYLNGPKPTKTEKRSFWQIRMPEFVKVKSGSYSVQWEALQSAKERGEFSADYAKAEREAIDTVKYAKLHFITKQDKKLTNATKSHTGSPELSGRLGFNSVGVITGVLIASYENGDQFQVDMSVIVNYRYNSRSGGSGGFYQFPARFALARIGGESVKARLSEKWMSENFK